MSAASGHCELCDGPGGEVFWEDGRCRAVRVADAEQPGFCRIVWSAHVAEMSDLNAADRRHLMSVVCAAEAALRALLRPDKINLASLGNAVPHLHWHVIPRWRDDRHFPNSVWGAALRPPAAPRTVPTLAALRDGLVRALAEEQGGEA